MKDFKDIFWLGLAFFNKAKENSKIHLAKRENKISEEEFQMKLGAFVAGCESESNSKRDYHEAQNYEGANAFWIWIRLTGKFDKMPAKRLKG